MPKKNRLRATEKTKRISIRTDEYNIYAKTFLNQYRPGDPVSGSPMPTPFDGADQKKYALLVSNSTVRTALVNTQDGSKRVITGYRLPSLEDLNRQKDMPDDARPLTENSEEITPHIKGLSVTVNGQIIIDRETEALLRKLKDHNQGIYEHSINVGNKAYEFAKYMHYPDRTCENMRIAGYLHDIGNLAVDKNLLAKRDSDKFLSMHEAEHVQAHVLNDTVKKYLEGYDPAVIQAANGHHLSYTNGIGYPNPFLSGDDIPLVSRMIAICDVYESILMETPYKPTHTAKDAINAAKDSKILDPGLLKEFISMIAKEEQLKIVGDYDKDLAEKQKVWDTQLSDLAVELGVSMGTLITKSEPDGYKVIKYKDPFTEEMIDVGSYDEDGNCLHQVTREYLKEQIDSDIRFRSGRERRVKNYFNDLTGLPKNDIIVLRRGEDTKPDGRPLDTSYEVVTKVDGIDDYIHLGSVNARGSVTDSISKERLQEIIEDKLYEQEMENNPDGTEIPDDTESEEFEYG